MKYTYIYKTSDGVRHEDAMNAVSREEVFATLRQRGIKAIKVVAADGSKANGEISGFRRRVVVLIALCAAALAGIGAYVAFRLAHPGTETEVAAGSVLAKPLQRQVIPGDRERIEKLPKGFFPTKADAFLSRFAEPGRPFSAPVEEWPSKAEFEQAFKTPLAYLETDYTERIDLKRMVASLREEARAYIDGGGWASGYVKALVDRQRTEQGYRDEAENRLKKMLSKPYDPTKAESLDAIAAPAYRYWLEANAKLQSMGIYPLPIPGALKSYQPELGKRQGL